jgi:hypothetical protein
VSIPAEHVLPPVRIPIVEDASPLTSVCLFGFLDSAFSRWSPIVTFQRSRPILFLKQPEWRLRWAEKAGTGSTLPGHQQAVAETPNGESGKVFGIPKSR